MASTYGRLAYVFFSKLINWLIVYRVIDDISQYVAIENLLIMLGYAIITLTSCMRVYIVLNQVFTHEYMCLLHFVNLFFLSDDEVH